MTTTLKDRLASGEPLFGTFLSLGNAITTEIAAQAGYDWFLVDLEHGLGGEREAVDQLVMAERHDVPVVVRIEISERIRTGRVLDLGANAVMFPRLESTVQVAEATRGLFYPPEGTRGVASYNRARRFGHPLESATETNQQMTGVVQIETLGALACVEEIAALEGVDVLFVGPGDLTAALGVPGQTSHPHYVEALGRIVKAAEGAGIAAGILANDATSAQHYAAEGFRLIAVASDALVLANSFRALIADLRSSATIAQSAQ